MVVPTATVFQVGSIGNDKSGFRNVAPATTRLEFRWRTGGGHRGTLCPLLSRLLIVCARGRLIFWGAGAGRAQEQLAAVRKRNVSAVGAV